MVLPNHRRVHHQSHRLFAHRPPRAPPFQHSPPLLHPRNHLHRLRLLPHASRSLQLARDGQQVAIVGVSHARFGRTRWGHALTYFSPPAAPSHLSTRPCCSSSRRTSSSTCCQEAACGRTRRGGQSRAHRSYDGIAARHPVPKTERERERELMRRNRSADYPRFAAFSSRSTRGSRG